MIFFLLTLINTIFGLSSKHSFSIFPNISNFERTWTPCGSMPWGAWRWRRPCGWRRRPSRTRTASAASCVGCGCRPTRWSATSCGAAARPRAAPARGWWRPTSAARTVSRSAGRGGCARSPRAPSLPSAACAASTRSWWSAATFRGRRRSERTLRSSTRSSGRPQRGSRWPCSPVRATADSALPRAPEITIWPKLDFFKNLIWCLRYLVFY